MQIDTKDTMGFNFSPLTMAVDSNLFFFCSIFLQRLKLCYMYFWIIYALPWIFQVLIAWKSNTCFSLNQDTSRCAYVVSSWTKTPSTCLIMKLKGHKNRRRVKIDNDDSKRDLFINMKVIVSFCVRFSICFVLFFWLFKILSHNDGPSGMSRRVYVVIWTVFKRICICASRMYDFLR